MQFLTPPVCSGELFTLLTGDLRTQERKKKEKKKLYKCVQVDDISTHK